MPEPTTSSFTLRFPDEQPVLDVLPLDAQPPAPAPVLVPAAPPEPPEPPPDQDEQRPQWQKPAAITGVAAAVVAVVVTVVLVASSHGKPTELAANSPVADDSSVADSPSAPPAPAVTSNPAPTDENSAHQTLENEVATDRPQVEALVGRWVPQLSSKRPGLVVDGTTYDYQAIWSDFSGLKARYPDALLLWSGDYSSFRLSNFWVTVVPRSYDSGDSANSWCDSEGIDKDNCYAKFITHTGGYADSTDLRN